MLRFLLSFLLITVSASAIVEHKERYLGPTGMFGVTSPQDIKIVKVEPGSPAAAIDLAEATGKLTLTRNDGSTVDIKLPILPKYGAAAKEYLPKIRAINAGKFANKWEAMTKTIKALPPGETKTITFDEAMKAGTPITR